RRSRPASSTPRSSRSGGGRGMRPSPRATSGRPATTGPARAGGGGEGGGGGRAQAAVTPRALWKASDHRAGSRERADKAEIRRSIRLQLAIVGFAIIITMFVLLGTIINNQGGTAGTRVFPWEWGSSDN